MLDIVALESKYLEDAAALVAARYRRLRETIPELPAAKHSPCWASVRLITTPVQSIRDPGTASVVSAFTRPYARGVGVATALLDCALAWARAEGYSAVLWTSRP